MARASRTALALIVVAAVAAGCGDGDNAAGSATPAPTAAAADTPAAPAAAPEPTATAAPAARGVRLKRIGEFDDPLYVTAPPEDRERQFVVERAGRVLIVRGGRTRERPFLDIRDRITAGAEQGLLSLAFAPDYARSRRFYVYYTDTAGDQRIVEYRSESDERADAGSARLVLRMDDSEVNHNGGLLLFGPDDLLYVGTGDGGGGGDQHGSRGNAQDLGSLLGKILRIDPRPGGGRAYRVPDDNPFVGRSGARGEIYAYGLRNPWRFAFDRVTGDLAIGDVGQNEYEEISFVRRGEGSGANFGWRPYEGREQYAAGESAPGHVRPVIVRTHSSGNCSITGGVFVRDPRLAGSGMRGRYLFADFCQGRVESARFAGARASAVRRTSLATDSVSSFGEDARGRVYVTSLDGSVYRIVPR